LEEVILNISMYNFMSEFFTYIKYIERVMETDESIKNTTVS